MAALARLAIEVREGKRVVAEINPSTQHLLSIACELVSDPEIIIPCVLCDRPFTGSRKVHALIALHGDCETPTTRLVQTLCRLCMTRHRGPAALKQALFAAYYRKAHPQLSDVPPAGHA